MPRRSKGAHLWLRPERRGEFGKVLSRSSWFILDAGRHIATGCAEGETRRAEEQLAAYIAAKYQPMRRERDIETIDVADVLSIYYDDRGPTRADRRTLERRLARLNEFWGGRMLADVNGATCRDYAIWRRSIAGARRDLEDLRAAINHHAKEGYHRGLVGVTLPPKAKPRDRWLTRAEAAQLLWTCYRTQEVQVHNRPASPNLKVVTNKYPLRHLVPFVLFGLYTGTRASAILAASFDRQPGRSWIDLDSGIFYRRREGQRETNKRQPPVPLPPQLLAHLRRWRARGLVGSDLIEWNGQAVRSIKTGFASAVRRAGLKGKVTPHTLRHTAATWLMQAGVDKWEAAGFLGMSTEILDRVYGHHHPDHLRTAARAIGYRRQTDETLVMPLVADQPTAGVDDQVLELIGGPGRTRTCNQIVMSDRL